MVPVYVLQCVAVNCNVLQCVAVCCSELQCVALDQGFLMSYAALLFIRRSTLHTPLYSSYAALLTHTPQHLHIHHLGSSRGAKACGVSPAKCPAKSPAKKIAPQESKLGLPNSSQLQLALAIFAGP